MKYEEIEVGEFYNIHLEKEKVIAKVDEDKSVATVDDCGNIKGWYGRELEKFQPIKKELPESGLLVCVDKDDFMVYRTGDVTGFGFNHIGKYDIVTEETKENGVWTFISNLNSWRTATPEDKAKFIKMLKAEAEKRGLGVDAKIKEHADGGPLDDPDCMGVTPKFELDIAFNKNGRIFLNGIWAEPLTMLDEVTEVIKKHLPNIVVEQIDGVVTLKQL